MRRLVRFAARLYPAPWRARYGDEFETLLDDMSLGWDDLWNVLWGAARMQIASGGAAKSAAAAGLAGAALAAALAFTIPQPYVSTGVLRMAKGADKYSLIQQALSRQSLAKLMQSENLYETDRSRVPLEDIVEKMRRNIRITMLEPRGGPADRMSVQFSYPDAVKAQRTTRELMSRIVQAPAKQVSLEVLQPPDLPKRPSSRDRWLTIAGGLIAGLLLGAVLAGVRRRSMAWTLRVAACGAAGMLLGAAVSLAIPSRYVSAAVVRARTVQPPLIEKALTRDVLESIIRHHDLYRRERSNRSLDRVIENMRNDIRITRFPVNGDWEGFRLAFTYRDRYQAQTTVRDLIAGLARELSAPAAVQVIEPPALPQAPANPRPLVLVAIGLTLGLLAGALAIRERPAAAPA